MPGPVLGAKDTVVHKTGFCTRLVVRVNKEEDTEKEIIYASRELEKCLLHPSIHLTTMY